MKLRRVHIESSFALHSSSGPISPIYTVLVHTKTCIYIYIYTWTAIYHSSEFSWFNESDQRMQQKLLFFMPALASLSLRFFQVSSGLKACRAWISLELHVHPTLRWVGACGGKATTRHGWWCLVGRGTFCAGEASEFLKDLTLVSLTSCWHSLILVVGYGGTRRSGRIRFLEGNVYVERSLVGSRLEFACSVYPSVQVALGSRRFSLVRFLSWSGVSFSRCRSDLPSASVPDFRDTWCLLRKAQITRQFFLKGCLRLSCCLN